MRKQITTIRLTDEDRAVIEQLKHRFGLSSATQVIRLSLRMLAERQQKDTDQDTAAGETTTQRRLTKRRSASE